MNKQQIKALAEELKKCVLRVLDDVLDGSQNAGSFEDIIRRHLAAAASRDKAELDDRLARAVEHITHHARCGCVDCMGFLTELDAGKGATKQHGPGCDCAPCMRGAGTSQEDEC